MTKRDMAIYLDIDTKTLYNWRKHKPNLYRIVMLGFAFKSAVEKSKLHYEELKNMWESVADEKKPQGGS